MTVCCVSQDQVWSKRERVDASASATTNRDRPSWMDMADVVSSQGLVAMLGVSRQYCDMRARPVNSGQALGDANSSSRSKRAQPRSRVLTYHKRGLSLTWIAAVESSWVD